MSPWPTVVIHAVFVEQANSVCYLLCSRFISENCIVPPFAGWVMECGKKQKGCCVRRFWQYPRQSAERLAHPACHRQAGCSTRIMTTPRRRMDSPTIARPRFPKPEDLPSSVRWARGLFSSVSPPRRAAHKRVSPVDWRLWDARFDNIPAETACKATSRRQTGELVGDMGVSEHGSLTVLQVCEEPLPEFLFPCCFTSSVQLLTHCALGKDRMGRKNCIWLFHCWVITAAVVRLLRNSRDKCIYCT